MSQVCFVTYVPGRSVACLAGKLCEYEQGEENDEDPKYERTNE